MPDIIDIKSLFAQVKEINSQFKSQVWWRGQSDFDWKLEPSIFRKELEGYDEKSGIRRFIQKAQSRHNSVPPISEQQNWLFLMQHYGLPTRLLDWTESPLIACYFATTQGKEDEKDGALYAISPYRLNEIQTEASKLLMPYDLLPKEIINSIFEKEQVEPQKIIAIRPAEVDIRLLVQMSVFTLHGSNESLEDIPSSQNFIYKITIPSTSKKRIKKQLKLLGVRESNIFPDLDHLAKEIKALKFKKAGMSYKDLEIDIDDVDYPISGESST